MQTRCRLVVTAICATMTAFLVSALGIAGYSKIFWMTAIYLALETTLLTVYDCNVHAFRRNDKS